MLPVFLAILFMGGSEQALHPAPYFSLRAHPRSDRAKPVSPRISYASARTALCLLPALLTQAYQDGSHQSFGIPHPARRAGDESQLCSYLAREFSIPRASCVFSTPALAQRPPPSV
jgi:hypothetical protein